MPIRVGVIGLEYGAQVHVPAYKEHPKYELVAVCSRTTGRAATFAREQHIPNWYTDALQLIAAPDIDLISVATPPVTHARYSAAALARRRHVLSEVAFVPTAADARVLANMAAEAQRAAAVAFILRYKPHLRLVSDLLARGAIGHPRLMRFEYFSNFMALPDGTPGQGWMWDADNGGGILANYVAHALDLARCWFGQVVEVDATLATLSEVDLPPTVRQLADDTGNVTLRFAGGPLAVFTHSAVTAVPRTSIELHGTDGSLLIDGFGDQVALLPMGADTPETMYPPIEYLEATRGQSGVAGAFNLFLDELAVAITEGQAPHTLPTFADGLEVMRVLDAIRRAAREKRRVALSELAA
jgi:predicted dehydrogenase